jgi:hypothetical protein
MLHTASVWTFTGCNTRFLLKFVCLAIADQKIEPSCPSAELMTENLGGEVKANHKCERSAAPVPSPEKWSHEAIVARANARPGRMQKLKVAGNSGQNPGFDFLQECWKTIRHL